MSTRAYWTDSWNPVTGCTPCSPGCDHCYARAMADSRLRGKFGYPEERPFQPGVVHPEKFALPLTWRKPRLVFVGNMGDLFHEQVAFPVIQQVFRTMRACHLAGLGHIFLLLTKRPARMLEFFERAAEQDFLAPNYWTGVTAENDRLMQERMPYLLQCPGPHWLSYEPALGPLDSLHLYLGDRLAVDGRLTDGLSWVAAGGENGRQARLSLAYDFNMAALDCALAGVPWFFKGAGSACQPSVTNEHARLDAETMRQHMPVAFDQWANVLCEGAR